MQSIFDNHVAQGLVDPVDDFFSFSSRDVIHDGVMYVYHREKIPLAQKRRVILTSQGLFVVNRKRRDLNSDRLYVDVRVNTMWASVYFACKDQHADSDIPFPFNVSFLLKGNIVNFYLTSESAFLAWKKVLENVGIQTNFAQKYKIIKPIGKGSSASVFEIAERETGLRAACKVFAKKALLSNKVNLKGLINEIRILHDIKNHPNLLQIKELHETDSNIYIVTELIEGDRVFHKKIKYPAHEICNVVESLLAALVFLKDKGIVHRDLKPDNMLLKYKDRPLHSNEIKIMDFGLATYYASEKQIFTKCGTAGFIAPEVLRSGVPLISPAMDIYSFGIILYNFITGSKAFRNDSNQDTLENNKRGFVNFYHLRFEKVSPERQLTSARTRQTNAYCLP